MRSAQIDRKTAETVISLTLTLDGSGKANTHTGCGFLNHMLTLFARHGRFDLNLSCKGDTDVDFHHTAEDIGICLGDAFAKCLGDMRGIRRYAHIILPMDETLVLCAADVSGRAHLSFDADFPTEKTGDFDNELIKEFFLAFVRRAGITLHIKELAGENSHHIAEAIFKAAARTLGEACSIDEKYRDEIPSTKGTIL